MASGGNGTVSHVAGELFKMMGGVDMAIAKDAIFARKILMDTIGSNMDELESMTSSGKASRDLGSQA